MRLRAEIAEADAFLRLAINQEGNGVAIFVLEEDEYFGNVNVPAVFQIAIAHLCKVGKLGHVDGIVVCCAYLIVVYGALVHIPLHLIRFPAESLVGIDGICLDAENFILREHTPDVECNENHGADGEDEQLLCFSAAEYFHVMIAASFLNKCCCFWTAHAYFSEIFAPREDIS